MFAVMYEAAVSIFVQAFVWMCFQLIWVNTKEHDCWITDGRSMPICLPKWLYPRVPASSVWESRWLCLDSVCSNRWRVVSHCGFNRLLVFTFQFSSVAQSCLTLCDPVNCSTPGLPLHYQLLESTHTHVHCVGDAIQLSHPLLFPSPPALHLSQHQGLFKWVSSSHQMAKVLDFQLQHQSFQLSELIVLTPDLELEKGKRVAIYSDSKYAFLVLHAQFSYLNCCYL